MAQNDIDDVLDQLRRIKSGGDQSSFKIDQIEKLEMHLRFLRTFIKYHHVLLTDFLVKIKKEAKLILKMLHSVFGGTPDECKTNLNVERLVSQLLKFIQGNTSSMCNFELNDDFDLLEYMDCLGKNLNDVLMFLELDRSDPSSANEQILQYNRVLKQVEIIQKKMRFLRYVYATEINSYVDHEKLEGLETRIQFMAESVGQFCLALFVDDADSDKDEDNTDSDEDEDNTDSDEDEDDTDSDEVEDNTDSDEDEDDTNIDEYEDDTDSDEVEDDILSKPPYLLCSIVLVELEMKKIFLGELKASKFTQSRIFKDKKLPKGFSHHLHSLLMYLRNKKLENFPNNVTAQNIHVAIEFLLIFLVDVSNHVISGKSLNEVLEEVGAIVGDILYVIQKLLPSSITQDDTKEINLGSIQILEKIEILKRQVEERYYKTLKFIPSQFPTVGGLSFLDSLIRKLNGIQLKSEVGVDFIMKPHICVLEKEFSSLISAFRDIVEVNCEHEILKDLQKRTISLAYEAEFAIDSTLVQYNVLWHLFWSLPKILKEIKHISAEVTNMWSENLSLKPCYVVEPFKHLPARGSNSVNDEEIVCFEIAAEKLLKYLTRGTSELDVIPIVGMGGQGKTTCARKLYNNDNIVCHFDVRAWCIVSQTYNRRKLLQEIFSQVTGSEDKGDKDDVLADMLRKSLMGKRYLIVLDDMWDGMVWDDLRLSFPYNKNGSRIVVTTRLAKVGEHVMHHIDPYYLPFLTPEESCQLLQRKIFQQEGCPSELQDVSLEVAKRCKGLPLVVVLAAGIIEKKKMRESWWHEVKDALFDYLDCESEDYSRATMLLSYENLPDHLRPCLLYIGMFPEDHIISVSQLISLWIAEGFVQNIESGRLEETAEGYLNDLISSNVVMVSKRRYNSKVKYCQVHDIVLHFCLEKSREERFMWVMKGHYSNFRPSRWKESRVSFSLINEIPKFASVGSKTRKPLHQHLRSLVMTNEGGFYDWNPFRQVSEVRLLKVLDLSSHRVRALSSATLKPLIHLKYLAVSTNEFHFHPKSHLPHLETLIVKGLPNPTYLPTTVLPAIFWKMEKLRCVELPHAKFDLEGMFKESFKLENLRILRLVVLKIDSRDVLLQRCPNLQQLYISLSGPEICLKLESLDQLQILRLSFGRPQIVSELHLPSNLNKLILFGAPIESLISFIAGLPSLEYLQLDAPQFISSEEWCLGDIMFPKLKVLKLVMLGISRWDVSDASFPQLETLVMKRCWKLEEIPFSFADIQMLKQIKLIGCQNNSLEASAERIKEEVEVIEGCDRLNLIII